MAHHKETHSAACRACKATGLYVGMAERNGAAVVCRECKGTGKQNIVFEWDDFDGKQDPPDGVTRVYATSAGIVSAPDVVPGGVSVAEWKTNPKSVHRIGAEMREHTCPEWWYQSANYALKPDWNECRLVGQFSKCSHFANKSECWRRFDRAHAK